MLGYHCSSGFSGACEFPVCHKERVHLNLEDIGGVNNRSRESWEDPYAPQGCSKGWSHNLVALVLAEGGSGQHKFKSFESHSEEGLPHEMTRKGTLGYLVSPFVAFGTELFLLSFHAPVRGKFYSQSSFSLGRRELL